MTVRRSHVTGSAVPSAVPYEIMRLKTKTTSPNVAKKPGSYSNRSLHIGRRG